MLLEMTADLSLTAIAAQIPVVTSLLVSWVLAGLSAFDFSDLAVGVLIYLYEKTIRNRSRSSARRPVRKADRRRSTRISPTLSTL